MQFKLLPFSPQLVQAGWEFGNLPSEDFPRIAQEALEAGFDGRCIRRIAGLTRPTRGDLQSLMGEFLQELGVETNLSRQEAGRVLARIAARAIAQGRISPYEGAVFIGYEIGNALSDLRNEFVPFVGLASEYEDCGPYSGHSEQTRRKIEQEILNEARELAVSAP